VSDAPERKEEAVQLIVRGANVTVSPALAAHAERRLRFAIGRFGGRVRRATVRLTDVNVPKGGCDIECRIGLWLAPAGEIEVSDYGDDAYAAIDAAADRIGRTVARHVARRLQWSATEGREGADVPWQS
jgi:putative sigma-54 modulation protein